MSMTIEIPAGLEGLGESIQRLVTEVAGRQQFIKLGRGAPIVEAEDVIAERAAEVEATALGTLLQSLDVDAPRVVINGVLYYRVGRYDATYHTLAGDVVVPRSLYRECETRNARTVDAVSLRAGVVGDGWLPQAAKAMAFLLQQGTSREAEQTGQQLKRAMYSRSSYLRVGQLVGELYVRRHADIELELVQAFEVPAEAHSISASLDRVCVPMEEPLPKPVGRPRKDAPKRPVARNFRQAYAGTVSLHDAQGDAIHTIRYGRMPNADPAELCENMAGDILTFLQQRPGLEVSLLADGAPEMWGLLTGAINEELLGVPVRQTLDMWHLLQKLGSAARVMHSESYADHMVDHWRLMLLNGSHAAARILSELKHSGMEHSRAGDSEPVHEAITYLTNHKHRVDYATARKRGLPIGSGVVEATCKSLFEVRLKRPGARWKEHTGERVVQLRALALSDRWDQAMHLVLAPLVIGVKKAA